MSDACRRAGSPALRQAGRLPLRALRSSLHRELWRCWDDPSSQGCRSASKRATTCLVSMPSLTTLVMSFFRIVPTRVFLRAEVLAMARRIHQSATVTLTSNRRQAVPAPNFGWLDRATDENQHLTFCPTHEPQSREGVPPASVGKAGGTQPLALDERTGQTLWQYDAPRLGADARYEDFGGDSKYGGRSEASGLSEIAGSWGTPMFCVARQPEVRVPGDELNRRRADERFVGGFRRRDFIRTDKSSWCIGDDKKRVTVSIGSVLPANRGKARSSGRMTGLFELSLSPAGSAP